MAHVMPSIRVTDPHSKDAKPLERQDTGKLSTKGDAPSLTGGKLASMLRSPTSPPSPTAANDQIPLQNGGAIYNEGRTQSETAIDPLSQQILQRTNTSHTVQKLRMQQTDGITAQPPTSPNEAYPDTKAALSPDAARDIALHLSSKSEKKKGVSFLSRFIGNKKKGVLDGAEENGSEPGDSRPEGMDAQLFSHTVDNLGFSPKHLHPPAYIKVRAKFKKEREFDRVFLAQELRSGTAKKAPPAPGANPAPQSGSAASQNPIWATEFSKDGRYLACGGQDRVVRVWAVISTADDRRAHEKDESGPNASDGEDMHLSAPVFQQKTFREYEGHTATILDLSWSKNNFLLSSSMDKTVRLWHISRAENLCTFKHTDFVPSIQFHPRDDRFFLAGSLDNKLRLWSIPDKSVAFWSQLPDMITAVSFTPDGKTCIAGTRSGLCMFYETEGLKYQTQLHVKSTRGQNAKGSKITGIQATHWPPGSTSGEVKLLVSSNDSRVRMYNLRDKNLEFKFRGHENNCSQIRAAFADDTGHIICGSEDRKAYIWSVSASEGDKTSQRPMEMFEAHSSITTCAVIAPLRTRQLLSGSEDPIYDLCNPPPVTLISREESRTSSRAPTDAGFSAPTPVEADFKRVAESPAYITRSAHTDGLIIVTADYTGALKVFRQDCAYAKRLRDWDASSVFSRRTGSKLGRPSSIVSSRTRRDSTSTQPPDDRIMSWRQDISHGSFDSANGKGQRHNFARSASPRKSRLSIGSSRRDSPFLGPTLPPTNDTSHPGSVSLSTDNAPKNYLSLDRTPSASSVPLGPSAQDPPRTNSDVSTFEPAQRQPTNSNPLSVYNGQSWAFWTNTRREQLAQKSKLEPPSADRPELLNRISTVSKLSSEVSYEENMRDHTNAVASASASVDENGEVERCRRCGSEEFKVKARGLGGVGEKRLVCGKCGGLVE